MTGTSNDFSNLVHRIETRAAVRELDIGEDQAGPLRLGERHCRGMRTGDTQHAMAEALDQPLEVHGDEGLVFDDEHIGRDLGRELTAGFLDQRAQRRNVDIENVAASSSEKPSSATSRKAWRG